jgi:hypothetical protein
MKLSSCFVILVFFFFVFFLFCFQDDKSRSVKAQEQDEDLGYSMFGVEKMSGRRSFIGTPIEQPPPDSKNPHNWKAKAGRAAGPDGYKFGDFARTQVKSIKHLFS